jgi:hypothetical protein
MAEIEKLTPGCHSDDDCDEHSERGKRGKRGKRGRTGPTGPTGPTGTTGATGPTGPSTSLPIIAAMLADGATGTVLSNNGFTAFNKISTGVYQLPLAGVPPPDADCVVSVTTNSPVFVVAFVTSGILVVNLFNNALAPVDANVNAVVVDNA